jgi:hypothetical protein
LDGRTNLTYAAPYRLSSESLKKGPKAVVAVKIEFFTVFRGTQPSRDLDLGLARIP